MDSKKNDNPLTEIGKAEEKKQKKYTSSKKLSDIYIHIFVLLKYINWKACLESFCSTHWEIII